jgi:hypothetical protein
MTESDAVAIAKQYAAAHQLRYEKVSHAVFVCSDDPFHPASHDNDVWYIYFDLPTVAGLERFNVDYFLIEVDCVTHEATLKPSL